MSDKFSIISIKQLYKLIINEEQNPETKGQIFGIPSKLFFVPSKNNVLKMKRYGQDLETPIGVAAGPHTQMAQNIIAAWLCGARYIEIKTIQTLDEISVSKPCIDMQDEGYNCEWSQELRIKEAFDQYLNAWIIIHLLKHKFGWNDSPLGTIFNMSVGYNMEGILKDNVQWFFEKMNNCKTEKNKKIESLASLYPEIKNISIPDRMSDNITLSTMHGCPPDEIEKIGLYLIENKKLNTTIKLNPTLLGAGQLREILNSKLGFKTIVPDIAFEHDLKYPDAIKIINSLTKAAKNNNVSFSLKLTNTLESVNNKTVFSENEKMMYMSGRALHPISINLAKKIQNDFDGNIDISFSAGADCFNIPEIISCGIKPVTVSSDVLKPGGYGRLNQYIENLTKQFKEYKAKNIDEFILNKDKKSTKNVTKAALNNLNKYSEEVFNSPNYTKPLFFNPDIKTSKQLNYFDCISAPCVGTCPTNQDIPDYLYYTAKGDFEKAFEVIMKKNPFPSVLGMVCDHLCQSKCTRINFDNSLLIRDIKRFIAESKLKSKDLKPAKDNGLKIAIIGAGPSGLACGYFLKLAGFDVDIYETKNLPGGMVSDAIPSFRLTYEAINKDIKRIENLGVKIHYNCKIDSQYFKDLRSSHNYIYLAVGAQNFKILGIEGENSIGVINPFKFLSSVKHQEKIEVGKNIAILGGGNTAIDVARTAYRIAGNNSNVTIIYRRSMNEMPADVEEIKALLEEGIKIQELTAPSKIISKDGKVKALVCYKMQLTDKKDNKGRLISEKIEGSEFEIKLDTIIPAIGQDIVIDFVKPNLLEANEYFETKIKNVFIGGDAMRGPATIIKAVADGRKVAENIIKKSNIIFNFNPDTEDKGITYNDLIIKKSQRVFGTKSCELEINNRKNFDIVVNTLTKEQAIEEASRCLLCNEVCSICVTVCPNRANYCYFTKPLSYNLQKIEIKNGKPNTIEDKLFEVKQKYQIINIADFCNECGNCDTFCPSAGAPYKNKPKFYIDKQTFLNSDSGYFINKHDNKVDIIYKKESMTKTLSLLNDSYIFTTNDAIITFNKNDFRIKNIKILNSVVKELYFNKAAEMSILLEGAKNLY